MIRLVDLETVRDTTVVVEPRGQFIGHVRFSADDTQLAYTSGSGVFVKEIPEAW
ncbi:MAG: hypothetical protein R3314_00610 [Longimicrobiales bacterium]|nr:hypothetical protein [Longimicrobiales bacterium]